MIYLIGGAPRTGKSTIAKQFAKSINSHLVSTDEIEKPNQGLSVRFYSDAKKNTMTLRERMQGIIIETELVITDISSRIKTVQHDSVDIVIEGIHVMPAYVVGLGESFGAENIKSIFIGSTDIEIILRGMEQNTSSNNWPKEFGKQVLLQISQFTIDVSKYLSEETQKHNLSYKERSNDFQKDISDIIEELAS